jgi:hypothetical protein
MPGGVAAGKGDTALLAGDFQNTISIGGNTMSSMGSYDVLLARFSAAGDSMWSSQFGDSGEQRVRGLDVDDAGNILLAGLFSSSIDFGAGPLTANGPALDIYIAKLSASGVGIWSYGFGGGMAEAVGGVAADGAGAAFLTGDIFNKSVDFGGGPLNGEDGDLFVVKRTP